MTKTAAKPAEKKTEPSAFIAPTIGRKVWFIPQEDSSLVNLDRNKPREDRQPMDATIVYVHNDRLVNLQVRDHEGFVHTKPEIILVQDGDDFKLSEDDDYAVWMPFQIGQAKKAE